MVQHKAPHANWEWPDVLKDEFSSDFPEPDNPVITVKLFLGISTLIFLRLCSLAPVTIIESSSLIARAIFNLHH